MTKTNKGFTLIELLVVVAIIGILATVVLASLGTARAKAKDAAAKSAISSMRAEAELDSIDNGDYAAACAALATLDAEAEGQTNTTGTCVNVAAGWAYELELNSGKFFCADSTGVVAETTATVSLTDTNYSCN